jgi:hypothetical protein
VNFHRETGTFDSPFAGINPVSTAHYSPDLLRGVSITLLVIENCSNFERPGKPAQRCRLSGVYGICEMIHPVFIRPVGLFVFSAFINDAMTRQFFLLALFIFSIQYGNSQAGAQQSAISLSIGAALPIGDFGKKDLDDASSGFSKLGPSMRLTARFPSNKRFGITTTLFTQLNPLDIKTMAEEFNSATFYRPSIFFWDGSSPLPTIPVMTTQFRNWHFEKDRWFMLGLLAGVYGNYSLKNNKTFLTASLLTGATYVGSPKLHGSSIESTQSATIHQESSHGIGFSSSVTFGITHELNKKLSCKASIDYLNIPSVRFKDVTATFNTVTMSGGGPGMTATQHSATGDIKQKIGTISINAGIVLHL